MLPLSVVMITKNEAHILGQTLESLRGLSEDIVIADNGSTDGTQDLAASMGCQVHEVPWEGFGRTKNRALQFARHDWILFLDADEALSPELCKAISQLPLDNPGEVYEMVFRNYIGQKALRYGEWRGFKKIRLFNRQRVQWTDSPVHEALILPADTIRRVLPGLILHHSIRDLSDYAGKINQYAELMAQRYFQQGKKASGFKLYLYPFLQFLLIYIVKLGFLDGWLGFVSAWFHTHYTFLKYHRLRERWQTATAV